MDKTLEYLAKKYGKKKIVKEEEEKMETVDVQLKESTVYQPLNISHNFTVMISDNM